MNPQPTSTLADYFPSDLHKEIGVRSGKRPFSPLLSVHSPMRKRRRKSSDRPILRVDCTVSPRLPPKSMTYPSPLQFSLGPSLAANTSIHYSSEYNQHGSHVQQPTTDHGWGSYAAENFQPAWTSAHHPYNSSSNFVELCQTSVASAYSVYSCASDSQSPRKNLTEVAQPLLTSQANDTRDMFIKAAISRLIEVKETLATEQRAIEELLEVAKLMTD
jgi:hypothetical protein